MTRHLQKITHLLAIFLSVWFSHSLAQTTSKKKAKTHKVHKNKTQQKATESGNTKGGRTIYTGPRGGIFYINNN
ncbi:hypothetical protein [Frigoriflavimonas asaccharolytica]|uniref:Uncharacterized protein n=1 Tax=Frigoriflavimonas asaccharolytica TaxID=2735899 RepID=A0A8J8G552_9FLAO|nr:hypothetical protein [Frigoriflavimonas asaccharolytica]NRS91251.1 hypothetical protein [Frigoriflavimonas asaccharolytica]